MSSRIYLIRHGKCQPNTEKIFRSRLDYPLNVTGTRQAQLLAQELRQVAMDAVYTSPLQRARQTADIICRSHGLQPEIQGAFNNMDIGPWDARPQAEIAREFPAEYETLYSRFEEFYIDGAETLADVQRRAKDAVDELVARHRDAAFAVVSHHTVLVPLFAGLLGMPAPYFFKFDPANASYTLFEHSPDQGYSLQVYNHTGHLDNQTPLMNL